MHRWLLLLCLVALACRADRAAPRAGHRIVCLTPSSTELVAAVGAGAEIIGVDRYSSYPEEVVAHAQRVGDFMSPNVEGILALTPDIAVADEAQSGLVAKLKEANIQVVTLRMLNIADVTNGLRELGRVLGRVDSAAKAVAAYEAELAELRAEIARRAPARRPRVLVVVDRQAGGLTGIYAAGPGTFLDEVLGLLGAENALAGSPVPYSSLAVEHIVTLAPDVILENHPGAPGTAADWKPLTSVPAVAAGRVFTLDDPALQAPTPRLPAAAKRLVPLLHP